MVAAVVKNLQFYMETMPIPVVVRFMTWACDCSHAGIVGSNPAEGMDICLLWALCVVG